MDTEPEVEAALPDLTIEVENIASRRGYHRVPATASRSRLGPGHLLLFLTTTSFYFALVGRAAIHAAVANGPWGFLGLVSLATLTGAAWAGVLNTAYQVVRERAFRLRAGHWLVILAGLQLTWKLLPGKEIVAPEARPLLLDALLGCVLVLPLLQRRLGVVWHSVFAILAGLTCLNLGLLCGFLWLDLPEAFVGAARGVLEPVRGICFLLLPATGILFGYFRGDKPDWRLVVACGVWVGARLAG